MRLKILTIIFVALYWTLMVSMHASAQVTGVVQGTGEVVTIDQFHPEPFNGPEIDWSLVEEVEDEEDICRGNPYCNPNDWK